MLSRSKNGIERKRITALTTALGVILIQIICLAFVQVANANSVLTFQCGLGTYTVSMPEGVARNGSGCEGELVLDSSVKHIAQEAFAKSKLTFTPRPLW